MNTLRFTFVAGLLFVLLFLPFAFTHASKKHNNNWYNSYYPYYNYNNYYPNYYPYYNYQYSYYPYNYGYSYQYYYPTYQYTYYPYTYSYNYGYPQYYWY